MPRPVKRGLDSFPLSVGFFRSREIACISEAYGYKGEYVALRLLSAIYRNGYFIVWDDAACRSLSLDMRGISQGLIRDIVIRLVKIGFFDPDLFRDHSVLTSVDIQDNYFSVVRRNRTSIPDDTPYLLLPVKKSTPKAKPPAQRAAPTQTTYGMPTIDRRTIEQKVDALKQDSIWLDQLQVLYHMSADSLRRCLDEFVLHCHAYAHDYSTKPVEELKRHFCNWMHRRPKTYNPPTSPPPSTDDYTFDGGFGGLDT